MMSETFTLNTRSLRKAHPEYADILSSPPDKSGFLFEVAGSSLACRDSKGWLHGPDDPWVEAQHEAASLVTRDTSLYVILRPGLGYLAFAVLEEIERRSPESFVLVVEDRLDLFRAGLTVVDWRPLLESVSSALLLGNPGVVVGAFLERHPAIAFLPMILVATAETTEQLKSEELGTQLRALTSKLRFTTELATASADDALRARRARHDPPRVLLAGAEYGYLSVPIAEGFRACGCDVEVQPDDSRTPRLLRSHDAIAQIASLSPDLVIWLNRPELSTLCAGAMRALGITSVLWSVDSPRRMRLTPRELEAVDTYFCFDSTYLEAGPGLGRCGGTQLSLAAGIRPLPGHGPTENVWPTRRGPEVSFVGSLGEFRIAEFRLAIAHHDPQRLAFLDSLAEDSVEPSPAYENATGQPYQGVDCAYIDEMRSRRRRIDVLSNVPANLLRIFGGTDWAHISEPLAACYAGRAPKYGLELASVYFHSKINLNVFHAQCVDSTNSRVYDVLAAGGFLLTEGRPCLDREFERGRHLVTYSSIAEAREKIEYYLTHSQERERIAREGQRHVLERHTFATRCGGVLTKMWSAMGRGLPGPRSS